MKLSFSILATVCLLIGGLVACKKNNIGIDRDPVVAPGLAEFTYYNASFAKDYYVLSSGNTFKVPVGITNVSNTDRTVQLTYTSTNATNGTQFTAPASVLIKAGQSLDSLTIAGNYANLTAGVPYLVKIKITGGDVPALQGKDSVMLTIRKYCDVVLANIAGAYNNTNEYTSAGAFSYGPYTTTITNLVSTGPTSATGKITNLYDEDWQPITANFDWSNPAAFTVVVPQQLTGSAGSVKQVRTGTPPNTFSSCDRSINISLDRITATGGVATGYRFVMK